MKTDLEYLYDAVLEAEMRPSKEGRASTLLSVIIATAIDNKIMDESEDENVEEALNHIDHLHEDH